MEVGLHQNGIHGDDIDIDENNNNTKHQKLDGDIDRPELVRLVIQSLQHLGYSRSAEFLEKDSGILLQVPEVTEFCKCMMEGRWDHVDHLLPFLGINDSDEAALRFLIYSQKFLELLEARNVSEALKVLRHEITPLKQPPEKLHRLASLVMCTDVEDLKKKAEWDGSKGSSRQSLLKAIRGYVSSTVMIPEHRLGELLKQAVSWQTSRCLYHNAPPTTYNLFEDHVCSPHNIPRETAHILDKHADEVWYIRFSHNGMLLASAGKDCTIILWEMNGFSVLHVLMGHTGPTSFVAWSPDDTMLLSCSGDSTIRLWNVEDGSCLNTFKHHSDLVTACAWLPDNKHFVSGSLDKTIIHSNIEGKIVDRFSAARVNDLSVSHDGKRMIAVCQEKKIRIESLDKSERSISLDEQNLVTSLELSDDSRFLLVNISASTLTEIHMWDLAAQRVVQSFRAHNQKRFVIRSCFGGVNQAFVLSGSEDKNVYVWRRENGHLLEVLQGHSATVNSVSWSPTNPHMFASASDDHTIRIWMCNPSATSSHLHAHSPIATSNGSSKKAGSSSTNTNPLFSVQN